MSFEKNKQGEAELRKACATALLRLATMLQASEKAEYVQKPEPSKPGEHLRAVSFEARDQLVYYPTSPQEVAKTLEVRVFYQVNAWYASMWEMRTDGKRRKGLVDKFMTFINSGIAGKIRGQYEK